MPTVMEARVARARRIPYQETNLAQAAADFYLLEALANIEGDATAALARGPEGRLPWPGPLDAVSAKVLLYLAQGTPAPAITSTRTSPDPHNNPSELVLGAIRS